MCPQVLVQHGLLKPAKCILLKDNFPVLSHHDGPTWHKQVNHHDFRPGEILQLLVRAHFQDGRVRDVTWLSLFSSQDDSVCSVDPTGLVRAIRAGETAVRIHYQDQVQVVVLTIPFDHEVEPHLFEVRENFIDDYIFDRLLALRIPPSPRANDATFLRRAFLDTIGTLPTSEEIMTFLANPGADKRAHMIEQLLDCPEFVDYWTLQLANLMKNRREREQDVRNHKGVRSFHAWLRRQVAANRHWNELARDVLMAVGDCVDQPQIGFYITAIGTEEKPEDSEITESTALSFLGTRIGCARCHNHPTEKYTQDDYYRFAGFFSRVCLDRVSPKRGKGPTRLLISTHELEAQKKAIGDLEKKVEDTEKTLAGGSEGLRSETLDRLKGFRSDLKEARDRLDHLRTQPVGVVQPRTRNFLSPLPLNRTPVEWLPEDDPRAPLMAWMLDPENELFVGNIVNRIWKNFMGVGLVEPVDDLRSTNPPSHPRLWKALNRDFVAHGYDLKHLMRLILNSRIYQLSSASLPGNAGDRRFYSHYRARRLSSEVLLDALDQVAGVPSEFEGYPVGMRAIQLPEADVRSYFLDLFGRSDRVTACLCVGHTDVTLPQVLHLRNAEGFLERLSSSEGRLTSLLGKSEDNRQVIENLFLATLGRLPLAQELEAVSETINAGGDRKAAFADLAWVLVNSMDFAFNH